MGLRKPKPDQAPASNTPAMPTHEKLPAFESNVTKIGTGVPQTYKNIANQSANVMWRAKVKGRKDLSDNIPLHMSLKTFDKPELMPIDEIKNKAKELNIQRPDPSKLKYEATTFQSPRTGQTYYMLKLHGIDPSYKQFNDHFRGQGITHDNFMGHITIDKELHDQIQKEGIEHHEVEFSPLMIEHGANNPTHLIPDAQSHNDHQSDITPKKLNAIPNYKTMKKSIGPGLIEGMQEALEIHEILFKGEKGDWQKEGYKISTHHNPKNGSVDVHAHDSKGNKVGHLEVNTASLHEKHPAPFAQAVHVHPEHRRKGIASAMHVAGEKAVGHKLIPHHEATGNPENMTEQGAKLWSQKNRSFGKSEEVLEKSIAGKIGTAAAIMGSMVGGSPAIKDAPKPTAHVQQQSQYSPGRMLQAISAVESSGGTNTAHSAIPGAMHAGEKAFGSYGLTPVVVRETIKMDPALKRQHPKAMNLHGQDMANYLQDNAGLEQAIASKHLSRLEHHFGQDPAKIGYAWLNGVTGTNRALKQGVDPKTHWHAAKVLSAYEKGK